MTISGGRSPLRWLADFGLVRVFLLALSALLAGYMFLGRGFAHLGRPPVYVGEVVFHKVELQTDVVARTETAKEVNALHRLYGLVDGDLAYAIDMAAVETGLTPHLTARLVRVPG